MEETENNFEFSVNSGFKSYTLLLVLIVTLLTTFAGFFFSMFFPYLIIGGMLVIPVLFSWVGPSVIKFGFTSWARKLSILPFFNYRGDWMLEVESEHRNLGSWQDFKRFTVDFFKYLALPIAVVRQLIGGIVNNFQNTEIITDIDLFVYWCIYIIPMILFVIIFTIKDVELKLIKKGEDGKIDKIKDSSYSMIGIITLVFGAPAVSALSSTNAGDFLVGAFIMELGITYFMGWIYYQTPFYQNNVNKIRNSLLRNHEELQITIGSTEYSTLFCNRCDNINNYPNYFCTGCGNDLSKMSTKFISDPVTIGTLDIIPANLDEITPGEMTSISRNYKLLTGFFIIVGIIWFPFLSNFIDFLFELLDPYIVS